MKSIDMMFKNSVSLNKQTNKQTKVHIVQKLYGIGGQN